MVYIVWCMNLTYHNSQGCRHYLDKDSPEVEARQAQFSFKKEYDFIKHSRLGQMQRQTWLGPLFGAKAPIVLYPTHEGHIQLGKSQFKFQLLKL
jgi:hypothetical protein